MIKELTLNINLNTVTSQTSAKASHLPTQDISTSLEIVMQSSWVEFFLCNIILLRCLIVNVGME